MPHLFENPVGKTEHEVIKEPMELMYEAETLGFDSVWAAEHHFTEYGYRASPRVSLAAVAARTKRIRPGTGVVVLPFHNPVRVAEDFAFLDLMSDGRVDLGVGRGYQPGEYAGSVSRINRASRAPYSMRRSISCASAGPRNA
jgi:alkanesulfonate monooxygenase SsuD/methylene tetrahydromethanopterin reductase-like flavin-dependent oxidoreductase (luciferase family)